MPQRNVVITDLKCGCAMRGAALTALHLACASASTAWAQSPLAEPEDTTQTPPFFVQHNRSIALQGLRTQQNYREFDIQGQTIDGTFNSERGHWQGMGLQARPNPKCQRLHGRRGPLHARAGACPK